MMFAQCCCGYLAVKMLRAIIINHLFTPDSLCTHASNSVYPADICTFESIEDDRLGIVLRISRIRGDFGTPLRKCPVTTLFSQSCLFRAVRDVSMRERLLIRSSARVATSTKSDQSNIQA